MAILKNLTINDTGYLQIPSGTIAQRPASPSQGMIRYNTDFKENEYYNGTDWITGTSDNSIVTDGLVLWLDAALPSSYPGSGTTWTDLSGSGNHHTLTGSPTFSSGRFTLDGSTQGFTKASSMSGVTSTNTVVLFYSTLDSQELWVRGNQNNSVYLSASSGNSYYHAGVGSPTNSVDLKSATNPVTEGYRNGKFHMWEAKNVDFSSWTYYEWFLYPGGWQMAGTVGTIMIYNKNLTQEESRQNFIALRNRYDILQVENVPYESLTYTASGNLTLTGNGTDNVSIFKTSGSSAWDNQAYSATAFTAPCTIEFNKQAGTTDNGSSYAMIGWNEDPTTDASYTSLDYAAYPHRTDTYSVYHNASQVLFSGAWSTANKFYIVYGTDGFIRHYNGSTLLYSVNYGSGKTVYVDSSFYSVNSTFGGFSNLKVTKYAWNGTAYFY
jgi:hypothetical protein